MTDHVPGEASEGVAAPIAKENRIRELEEFYEMAVGRELKMKELKEEMEKLREEVKDLRSRVEMS